ncbi:MAG: BMP family ABC transporter substrate-binding protein, partial [Methylococcales bacterium]|nr:BMP family ABC transporter substrate-binding protein [Methylococcales bacterium]
GEAINNVSGLIFPEDRAGFMGGALAAQLSESGTIASVLGTDLVPPVVAFGTGFENGAKYINPDINVITTYHPGGMDVAFVDPEWGATTAKQAIDQGADVIFGAGGKTGNGALIEVAGADGAYCIGVDSDQWETVPEAHPCLITSAMKLITPGVFGLIQNSNDGAFPAGNFLGEVGLADFHDFDSAVSDDIKATLAQLDTDLASGAMSTGYGDALPADEATDEAAADGDCSSPDLLCVGMVTDVGQVDDKSFNQSAWEGVQLAETELGAKVDFIETKDPKDYSTNIALFADEGYDIIVTVGFAMGEATAEAAAEYPDIYFIGVDQFQGEAIDNVSGLIFPEDRAGFMAGA